MTTINEGVHQFRMKQLREERDRLKKRRSERLEEVSMKKEIRGLRNERLHTGMTRLSKGINKVGRNMQKSNFFGGSKKNSSWFGKSRLGKGLDPANYKK